MADTGVLPFVRGIDFTRNDFGVSFLYFGPSCDGNDMSIFFKVPL